MANPIPPCHDARIPVKSGAGAVWLGRGFSRRCVLAGVLALGGVAALAACGESVASTAEATGAGTTSVRSSPRGDRSTARDFMFTAYQGGEVLGSDEVKLSQILALGKPVVLNFWAGLCPPCRVEMPDLQETYEQTKDRVQLIGLDVGPFTNLGTREQGKKLVAELGVTYPIGSTSDAQIIQKYRVLGMPTTVFIRPQAEIVRRWTGILTQSALVDLIGELEDASKA